MVSRKLMTISAEIFDNRTLASQAAANHVATAIVEQLANSRQASIVVGGGSSPEECFAILANTDIDWRRVHILPSDERCVPREHEASNAGMIQRLLVANRAAEANLLALYNHELSAEEQCSDVEKCLTSMIRPFAISLLGMGADGHFASLFADAQQITEGLDPDSDRNCMLVRTAASKHLRVSLTLNALINSNEILLLFFGDTKRDVYEQAKRPDSAYPLSKLLLQQRTPVRTIWAA